MEIWKKIPGYPHYEASSLGRIRHYSSHKIRRPIVRPDCGYFYLSLRTDKGRQKGTFIHKLVTLAFYGPHPGLAVDHINRVRTDNRIENLRIVTVAENNKNRGIYLGDIVKQTIELYKQGKSETEILILLNKR